MRCIVIFLSLALCLLSDGVILAAPLARQTEKTYCIGYAESSSGKRYRYCRQLAVEMSRGVDDSIKLVYKIFDDQGKALESEFGQITVKAQELKAFAIICLQAWELFSTRPEARQRGTTGDLEKFRGRRATYLCDADGNSLLMMDWSDKKKSKPNHLNVPIAGVCATLSLLSQTREGRKLVGDGKSFRVGIVEEPVAMPFKEQEEIDLTRSIVGQFQAGNWETLKMRVLDTNLDFKSLTEPERHYLSTVFARRGSASEAKLRMNSDPSFVVRLKLGEPETLKDLREAFREGYFSGDDAADACRRAANVKLLPIAAEFLFTDKAPKKVQMGDVFVDESPARHSADAIRSLLLLCPEFPEAVRTAAKTWDELHLISRDFLEPCRKWWNENRERIEKSQYDEVTAPGSRK